MDRATIAVTGATGLIGRTLCRSLAEGGYAVHALTRMPDPALSALPHVTRFSCHLPDEIDIESLRGCAAVIHCAYATRFRSIAEARQVNEDGTERLLALSRAAGVERFVFMSSTSAHADAQSYYGQSKRRLEAILDPERDLVIRPGLVVSPTGGLFQRLAGAGNGKRLPWIVPLFGGGQQPMQTILIDDLRDGVRRALDRNERGAITLASPERMTIREMFEVIAHARGRRVRFVPAPVWPALLALRAAERLGLPMRVSSENLLGLLSLRYWDSTADLRRLGIAARPLSETIGLVAGLGRES